MTLGTLKFPKSLLVKSIKSTKAISKTLTIIFSIPKKRFSTTGQSISIMNSSLGPLISKMMIQKQKIKKIKPPNSGTKLQNFLLTKKLWSTI